MSYPAPRKPAKGFAFDSDYRVASSNSVEGHSSRGGLVSFFSDEPPQARNTNTEWSATPASEEDLREGMDDYKRAEESGEDLKDLIAAMPHNVARRARDNDT